MKFNKNIYGKLLLDKIMNTIKPKFDDISNNLKNINITKHDNRYVITDLNNNDTILPDINMDLQNIYVDQINGDNSNNGSINAPVKTIYEAIARFGYDTYINIHIIGTYVMDRVLNIYKKNIILIVGKDASLKFPLYDYNYSDYLTYKTFIIHEYGSIKIVLKDTDDNGNKEDVGIIKLEQLPKPDDLEDGRLISTRYGMFGLGSNIRGYNSLSIISEIDTPGKTIALVRHGSIFYRSNADSDNTGTFLIIVSSKGRGEFIFNKDTSMTLATGYIMGYSYQQSPTRLIVDMDTDNLKDMDGNIITDYSKLVAQIRDVNGVPRNIVTNLII